MSQSTSLLSTLEAAHPIKRQITVPGWSVPIWIWRLDYEHMSQLPDIVAERGEIESAIQLCRWSVGTESGRGELDSEAGTQFLQRHPKQAAYIATKVAEFAAE